MTLTASQRNRKRLANKLRVLQGKFEKSIINQSTDFAIVNFSMPKEPKENAFKIMQGKRLRKRLGYKLSNVFKDFYAARKAHNKELGYTATGQPLKSKSPKTIIKKVNNQKVIVEKTSLHPEHTIEQIALAYYKATHVQPVYVN